MAQLPQAFTSLVRLTHVPAQFVFGGAQVLTQPVETHCSPAAQATEQDVHVAGFVRLASQPFDGSPSQSAKPGAHETSTHSVPLHAESAFARLPVQGLQSEGLQPKSGSVFWTHALGYAPPTGQLFVPAGHPESDEQLGAPPSPASVPESTEASDRASPPLSLGESEAESPVVSVAVSEIASTTVLSDPESEA
jgi:hypothetical protein